MKNQGFSQIFDCKTLIFYFVIPVHRPMVDAVVDSRGIIKRFSKIKRFRNVAQSTPNALKTASSALWYGIN